MTNGTYASVGHQQEQNMLKSRITTADQRLKNPHPGEILLEEFMKPHGLSQNAIARAIHVPPRRINEIIHGKRAITADTDLRLARYFGMSQGFFLGLQTDFDLMETRRALENDLTKIEPMHAYA
jgi:addiction module HigA family antidote